MTGSGGRFGTSNIPEGYQQAAITLAKQAYDNGVSPDVLMEWAGNLSQAKTNHGTSCLDFGSGNTPVARVITQEQLSRSGST